MNSLKSFPNCLTARMTTILVLAIFVLIGPCKAYAMNLEEMNELIGADMLGARVNDLIKTYGIPAAIIDRENGAAKKKRIRWKKIKMNLTDGDWDVIYETRSGTPKSASVKKGWINPKAAMPTGFKTASRVVFFTSGRAGYLEIKQIDKDTRKTTYTIPKDIFKAHLITGVKVRPGKPLRVKEIIKKYGRYDESVVDKKNGQKFLRYWVLVEIDVMPSHIFAVDFEINKKEDSSFAYKISTQKFDFVEKKFQEYYKDWEKFVMD